MCYVWGEMNHGRERLAMLMSRVTIAIPSLCAKAETNLRCVCRMIAAAGWNRKRKIELTGFEPATSSSRTKRATSLRYSSLCLKAGAIIHGKSALASIKSFLMAKMSSAGG